MAGKRTYGELCAAAHALDLVGERWALLVTRELLLGPKRFTDLRAGVANASPNVLSQRLRELEQAGIVRRRKLGPPAGAWVYELTDWGLELERVIITLGRWGARSPALREDGELSFDSLVLSFRALFDREASGELNASFELRVGEDRGSVRVAGGEIEAKRGEVADADAILEADHAGTLAAVLLRGDRDLDGAIGCGDLKLSGDAAAVKRLIAALPMPERATIAA